MGARTLIVTGDLEPYRAAIAALNARGGDISTCTSPAHALSCLADDGLRVVVCDADLGDTTGARLCAQIGDHRPDIRVIITSPAPTQDALLGALRAGAFDFLTQPVDDRALEAAIARAAREYALRDRVQRLRLTLAEATGVEDIIGASPPMRELYDLMERAAETTASVLLTGESGTGKELVARALHRRSRRREGPFVAINCSAIPDTLLESELFGHIRGAFTDAKIARSGLFAKASGGTIFLDELGEMPMSLQPRLLRALQERAVKPVGGDTEVPFDARVIAATNVNLETAVAEKQFREDLFYRINVIHIHIPPLRERGSDALLLAQHFVDHYAAHTEKPVSGLSPGAAEKLLAYTWPGNVRELQNCIERAVALTRHREVQPEDLPGKISTSHHQAPLPILESDLSELVTMDEIERRYVLRVMQAVHGNKKEAARILGFDRKTLYRKLIRYHIDVPRHDPI